MLQTINISIAIAAVVVASSCNSDSGGLNYGRNSAIISNACVAAGAYYEKHGSIVASREELRRYLIDGSSSGQKKNILTDADGNPLIFEVANDENLVIYSKKGGKNGIKCEMTINGHDVSVVLYNAFRNGSVEKIKQ